MMSVFGGCDVITNSERRSALCPPAEIQIEHETFMCSKMYG